MGFLRYFRRLLTGPWIADDPHPEPFRKITTGDNNSPHGPEVYVQFAAGTFPADDQERVKQAVMAEVATLRAPKLYGTCTEDGCDAYALNGYPCHRHGGVPMSLWDMATLDQLIDDHQPKRVVS